MTSDVILKATDLRVSFAGIKAADGVNIQVNRGEFVAVIGPNGSGKTTLLNICTGYITPGSGSVHLEGEEITGLAPRKIARLGIARAFQIPQLFSDQRVINNIMLGLAARHGLWTALQPLETPARRKEAQDLLELVGLGEDANRISSTLPEGHRKLLDIAIALALEPRLLLLDEPTSGVSALDRFPLMEAIMGAIRQRRISALFVEHDMDVVARYADRVFVWNAGQIMAEGTPAEVFSNDEVLKRVVGVA